jgi:hypothetical protein
VLGIVAVAVSTTGQVPAFVAGAIVATLTVEQRG